MILLGSVVNGGAVVVGGLVGMFVGKLLPERLRTSVMAALSLMTIGIAVPGLLKSNNALIPIISMVVGTLIGELMDIDSAVNKLGEKLQKRFSGSRVTEGFVTGSLVFAVGALADIIGGILAGYAINPLITLGAASIGLVGGWLWQTLPHTLRLGQRLLLSVVAAHVVGSIVINSLALHIFYGYAWSVLAARVPNALILTAVNTVLLRLLMENKAVMAAVKK